MSREHPLDLRRAGATSESIDDKLVPYEYEGRDRLDAETVRELRLLSHLDANHVHVAALLAGNVGEDALHSPGGTGAARGEEDE
jgi:hypothetical protein